MPVVAQSSSDIYGVITKISGVVKVQLKVDSEWIPAEKGMALGENTKVQTDEDGELVIVFEDGTAAKVDKNTTFIIREAKKTAKQRYFIIELLKGSITSNSATITTVDEIGLNYQIKTPVAVAAVRGTIFIVEHKEDKSDIAVFKGSVNVQGQTGHEIQVEQDYQTSVTSQKPPERVHPIEERLMKYYKEKVKRFNEQVEYHRARLDKIREQHIKWMEKQKGKYEDKMKEEKQKQEDKFEKLKKKHGVK